MTEEVKETAVSKHINEATEIEEKIMKLLNIDISHREYMRIKISKTQKDGEKYHLTVKRFYYDILKERNCNVPASCLTAKLKGGVELITMMRDGEGGCYYSSKNIKEVVELDEKGYLETKLIKKRDLLGK